MFAKVGKDEWHIKFRLGKMLEPKSDTWYFIIPGIEVVMKVSKQAFSYSLKTDEQDINFELKVIDPGKVVCLFVDYKNAPEEIMEYEFEDWKTDRSYKKIMSWKGRLKTSLENKGLDVIKIDC